MAKLAEALDREIVDLISETVREIMGPFGLADVTVRAGEDHDGDPVIYIEAHYALSEQPIDMKTASKATRHLTNTLCDRLWERGETRFPHTRHKFDERQSLVNA